MFIQICVEFESEPLLLEEFFLESVYLTILKPFDFNLVKYIKNRKNSIHILFQTKKELDIYKKNILSDKLNCVPKEIRILKYGWTYELVPFQIYPRKNFGKIIWDYSNGECIIKNFISI
jgi:hypothetical protein